MLRRTRRSARSMLDRSNARSSRFGRQTGASSLRNPARASSSGGARGSKSCLTDAVPVLVTKRPLLSFTPVLAGAPFGPSRVTPLLCPLLTSARWSGRFAPFSVRLAPDAVQISRGKAQSFPCVDARFIKHTPIAEGGLRCHVPTRPGCTTPHIWFLFVAPQFWIGLPSDPTSR